MSYFSGLTQGVFSIASKIREAVDDFEQEQQNFIKEKPASEKDNARESEAVPPWVGLLDEENLKSQILQLSSDKRNFLMDPPPGAEFTFDLIVYLPIAKATMAFDPALEKLRYELVPKQTKEYNFWRNYFYRVSLIKQSSQLRMLNQQYENTQSSQEKLSRTESHEQTEKVETPIGVNNVDKDSDSDFISDAIPGEKWLSDVKDELDQLGVNVKDLKDPSQTESDIDWEKELASEIDQYDPNKKTEDWETEIKEMLNS